VERLSFRLLRSLESTRDGDLDLDFSTLSRDLERLCLLEYDECRLSLMSSCDREFRSFR